MINEEFGGQGLAGRLAEAALKETVAEGLAIVPVCPFIKKFLTKHAEYAANATAPTLAHLEYLNAAPAPAAKA